MILCFVMPLAVKLLLWNINVRIRHHTFPYLRVLINSHVRVFVVSPQSMSHFSIWLIDILYCLSYSLHCGLPIWFSFASFILCFSQWHCVTMMFLLWAADMSRSFAVQNVFRCSNKRKHTYISVSWSAFISHSSWGFVRLPNRTISQ